MGKITVGTGLQTLIFGRQIGGIGTDEKISILDRLNDLRMGTYQLVAVAASLQVRALSPHKLQMGFAPDLSPKVFPGHKSTQVSVTSR